MVALTVRKVWISKAWKENIPTWLCPPFWKNSSELPIVQPELYEKDFSLNVAAKVDFFFHKSITWLIEIMSRKILSLFGLHWRNYKFSFLFFFDFEPLSVDHGSN
jgi:hypothetical protein